MHRAPTIECIANGRCHPLPSWRDMFHMNIHQRTVPLQLDRTLRLILLPIMSVKL